MNYPSLEARHVSRTFSGHKAVDDVSLTLEAGQIVALLGQSGSGKSTLLRMFAGLESLDVGEVYAGGTLVSSPSQAIAPEKRGLGMVFQDYALFPHLTSADNVAFGLQSLGKKEAKKLALDWLDKVGLADRARYFPHQLSGGEQQRVALARALAPQPSAILMDEPFSGLDPHLRADLQRTMLAALASAGVGALIVSHDTQEALALADQVAIMDHGRIIQAGAPRDVYCAPVSLVAARALGPVWYYSTYAGNGQIETPFGSFPTSTVGPAIVVARPEATSITAAKEGVFHVVDNRGVGRFLNTTLQGPSGLIQARVEAKNALAIGSTVTVAVAAEDVFVFEA
jgi:iron(III) transport system ATP-binding protein